MADTTTPPSIDALARVAVAYSGGRDSTALLHATACMARELGGFDVVALHVHHGLSQHADGWLAHAQQQCADWAAQGLPVRLEWRQLSLTCGPGDSVEAVARHARYVALAEMAAQAGCTLLLLAHHLQDQAETFLLQALRGAGVGGLAAMPKMACRQGLTWARPWLDHPRSAIEAYVAHHSLHHIEDDGNADLRYARNRLRLAVWPSLVGSFEQAGLSLAQAASHQADVLDCLNDWLAGKLPEVTVAVASGQRALALDAWQALSDGQQRQVLRAWFAQATGQALPMSWVSRLHEQVKGAGRWPIGLKSPSGEKLAGELVVYRGLMSWRAGSPALAGLGEAPCPPEGWLLSITGAGLVPVPQARGVLESMRVEQGGVPLSRLAQCHLRLRVGGEQFQLAPGRPARSLKKQFQMQAVPQWERQGPLLWSGSDLVFVPGLGIDARVLAEAGQEQVMLRWTPWVP